MLAPVGRKLLGGNISAWLGSRPEWIEENVVGFAPSLVDWLESAVRSLEQLPQLRCRVDVSVASRKEPIIVLCPHRGWDDRVPGLRHVIIVPGRFEIARDMLCKT